jgi:hypothetical protein
MPGDMGRAPQLDWFGGIKMSRFKRGVAWCTIMTTFFAFSAVLVGGMAGVGSAATVAQVASSLAKSNDPKDGSVVVVETDDNSLSHRLGGPPSFKVCWVSNSQAGAIRLHWRTTTTRVTGRYSLLTVYGNGSTEKELHAYVSGGAKCKIVHAHWAFFLPLDGAVS